jgi:hypothetical protein
VINSRLFTTVRDSLGLTYDVSFEVRRLFVVCFELWSYLRHCSRSKSAMDSLGLTYDVSFEVRGEVHVWFCVLQGLWWQ